VRQVDVDSNGSLDPTRVTFASNAGFVLLRGVLHG
jgi:hypothetical protein